MEMHPKVHDITFSKYHPGHFTSGANLVPCKDRRHINNLIDIHISPFYAFTLLDFQHWHKNTARLQHKQGPKRCHFKLSVFLYINTGFIFLY